MEVLRLEENHRSTPQVVRAAAEALGRGAVLHVRSTTADGPMPLVTAYDDENAEAEGVATLILDSAEGGRPWSEHAVLARTNEQLMVVGRALAGAGVPYRTAAAPEDTAPSRGPEVKGERGEWDKPGEPNQSDDDLEIDGGTLAIAEGGDGDGRSALDSSASVEARRAAPRAGNAVELATFHRAKGLEWDTVFVVGLEDGYVPIAYAISDDARAEERRLLYVALTRASRQLHCSWARMRRTGTGRRRERDPSPWLAAVARVSRPGLGRPAPGQAGRRIAELRAALRH